MTGPQQLLLELPLAPNFSATDFVESPCNEEATQWIHRWPDWPMKMIALYGEPGCGKTHLAHIWQEKAAARFLNPQSSRDLTPLEASKGADAFIIDDADTMTEEDWLFHFYNILKEKDAYLLLCGRFAPTQWAIQLPDLRSRLSTVFSIAIHPPDEVALRAVLFKQCSERGMILSAEVADYILRRVERSFQSIGALVTTLDRYALSVHRQPTMGLVRELFRESDG